MELELEQTRLRLIEAQMQLLQYQHREIAARVDLLKKQEDEKRADLGYGK